MSKVFISCTVGIDQSSLRVTSHFYEKLFVAITINSSRECGEWRDNGKKGSLSVGKYDMPV